MIPPRPKAYVDPPRAPRKNPEIAIISPPTSDNAKPNLGGGFFIFEKTFHDHSDDCSPPNELVVVLLKLVMYACNTPNDEKYIIVA